MIKKTISRRSFIGRGAAATAMVLGTGALTKGRARTLADASKIVIATDTSCYDKTAGTVDTAKIQDMVDHAIMILTGISDKGQAYEAIFPGTVTTATKIAIKQNGVSGVLPSNPTTTYVIQAVKSGLTSMLGGTFPEANVTIATGKNAAWTQDDTANASNPSFVFAGVTHRIKDTFANADWIINCPSLWSQGVSGVSMALKNLMSAVTGPRFWEVHDKFLDPTQPWLSVLNSQPTFKNKQVLVLMDAISGRSGSSPGGTPNMAAYSVVATRDSVANDYQGMLLFKQYYSFGSSLETTSRGIFTLAAQEPYSIGTNDPANMEVVNISPPWATLIETSGRATEDSGLQVSLSPNPSNGQVHFELSNANSSIKEISIVDVNGRMVWEKKGISGSAIHWGGRSMNGRPVPKGIYIFKIKTGPHSVQGKIFMK
ncbi:MAG: hypothetical protein A2487_02365 [Candidatus Raymondbacteria bacterium RifOxyC12_full_50_8]|uniref:DUF362 domain-containing protein n=1 Tax=Candidatus Raymondbacteria bacterium RIFOXYD12_FULL_49_13 TaxID=1817890 RepID=A0A1F7FHT4_UNCRA|nr:MAG: hypothetical protein A2248_20910 [Candidatus Raymondbacteria bacterium RIFOXYA2_FULL_49_16]OGJ99521.1 MAG: hypothetical protein A2350_05475 [Candidatus Raymondbacteria bacterium RifOxyB12_full_50_8]OGK06250.1 MAG: hypothetical protein A2519_08225 [Candidatus Raymondbacteria bacterium RIFOXYD12_FULL_49_13]OGK07707.1 MAG: hypothetical protein A2487_02365 [Candidatus Raymondbacteria bacterium RifOxyC12_full_50_8]OGP40582.1 MAG: hypothetical protein A2324_02980 [Candidatus Raymondbacteria b